MLYLVIIFLLVLLIIFLTTNNNYQTGGISCQEQWFKNNQRDCCSPCIFDSNPNGSYPICYCDTDNCTIYDGSDCILA